MSRNRYDAEYGVRRIRWIRDMEPPRYAFPILVEVWRASTESLLYGASGTKPTVLVEASVEVRIYLNDKWWSFGSQGHVREAVAGEVRRWARIPSSRSWSATITLDGWSAE